MDRYRIFKGDGYAYLLTFRFTDWLPIFNVGEPCAQIVLDSLDFCRRHKGLTLFASVLMIDHLHLIARHNDLSGVVRDFKTFTSRRIRALLEETGRERWLELLETRARSVGLGQESKVWEDGAHPKRIESDAMFWQKIEYVHNNPVRKGFVARAEDWRWSSARNYGTDNKGVMEIDRVAPLIF